MSAAPPVIATTATGSMPAHLARRGSGVAKWVFVSITVIFLTLMIVVPAANVFYSAFGKPTNIETLKTGAKEYVATFYVPTPADTTQLTRAEKRALSKQQSQAEKTRESIAMTVGVAAIVVPLNTIFGLAAAWAVAKFRFKGRTFFTSLIDLPFSVSPVVAGLIFVLLFGRMGIFGDLAGKFEWPMPLSAYWVGFSNSWWPVAFTEWKQGIVFTPLATVLASIFVTFPFVARSLIPLMETQGIEQEQAAITLGASGRQMFWRVTLPAIKWALLYGMILCTARCLGEFGAVSVLSGGMEGNDTMPLRIEKLWQEYNSRAAFSVASVLASISLVTLLLKVFIEWRTRLVVDEKKEQP